MKYYPGTIQAAATAARAKKMQARRQMHEQPLPSFHHCERQMDRSIATPLERVIYWGEPIAAPDAERFRQALEELIQGLMP